MSETATATKRRGRPSKQAKIPDLPTVATHGTTIDHSQVLDALGAIPQFPVPPMEVVMQWSQQVRAEVLRWANHTQRDTELLPAVLDAWLTQHGKIIPLEQINHAPTTDAPIAEEAVEPVQVQMTVEELREYMTREYMTNNYDPNSDDLSAILFPLGYDHERFDFEDCAPHWEEWQARIEGRPEYPGRAVFAVTWWKEKLQSDERTDGWIFLDAYMPLEALSDCGKIFAVIVRPISQQSVADTPADAPVEPILKETATSEDKSWLTAERERVASGRFESTVEKVQLDPQKEHKLTERLVTALKELEEAEEEKKRETKRLGEDVKELKETTNRLAEYIRNGWEETTIKCQWWYDYTNGQAELRREDNGELIKSRPLDENERQMRMAVEDDTHSLDAEAQPESERDKLIAECTRKALELRPALKIIHDDDVSRCAQFYSATPERPDGWPYNPSAAVLHTWSELELQEFTVVLNAISAAWDADRPIEWEDYLASGHDMHHGEAGLAIYWQRADNDGVMHYDAEQEMEDLYWTLHQCGNGDSPKWAEVNAWPVGTIQDVQNWLTYGKGDVPEVLKSYVWAANKPEEAAVTQQEAANKPEEVASEPEAVIETDVPESQETIPFCCCCKEDFPVATEPTGWSMGQMRLLKKAPKKIRERFSDWIDSEIHGAGYLCGNCYFDLTEEE